LQTREGRANAAILALAKGRVKNSYADEN
jgi:hypothetical protein